MGDKINTITITALLLLLQNNYYNHYLTLLSMNRYVKRFHSLSLRYIYIIASNVKRNVIINSVNIK